MLPNLKIWGKLSQKTNNLLHVKINILLCIWEQNLYPYVKINIHDLGKKLNISKHRWFRS